MRSESSEQIMFVTRMRHFYPQILLFAIPNGGGRTPRDGAKLKSEGVLPGVPDLMVAEARGGYHGLFIEMKRSKGGKLSDKQIAVLATLAHNGYKTAVCAGCEEAWKEFEAYMEL